MKAAVVIALLAAIGCGTVTADPTADGGTGGAGGKVGVTANGGAPGGEAGATGGEGQAANGGQSGGSGVVGSSGGAGGAGPTVSCGSGPALPGGNCSIDSDCLSGSCGGGFCAVCSDPNCNAAKAAAPALCVDNGWIPTSVVDCGSATAPVCEYGYRCLNCGQIPGNIGSCIYDRAQTSVCVSSCGDCRALAP